MYWPSGDQVTSVSEYLLSIPSATANGFRSDLASHTAVSLDYDNLRLIVLSKLRVTRRFESGEKATQVISLALACAASLL